MLKIVILTSEINSHVASCPSEGGLGTSRTDITWEQNAHEPSHSRCTELESTAWQHAQVIQMCMKFETKTEGAW